MAEEKTITKYETYTHQYSPLSIHVWSGNAHSTDIVIEKDGVPIANGTDDIQISNSADEENEIFIEARINRTTGSSSHVSLRIELEGSSGQKIFEYDSIESDFDIIIYHVTIQLN